LLGRRKSLRKPGNTTAALKIPVTDVPWTIKVVRVLMKSNLGSLFVPIAMLVGSEVMA